MYSDILYATNLCECAILCEFANEFQRFPNAESIVLSDDILAFPVYLLACFENRQIDYAFLVGNDVLIWVV